MRKVKEIFPGLVVSVGIISILLGRFIPKLGAATIAIFLGMFVGNLFLNQDIFQKGYKFSETDLLSYSIVLLGATLSVSTLMELGIGGITFIVVQMTITIIGALYIGKKLGFGQNFRFMMASGNAVCGSSAIAATAPVIDADDKEKGIVITIVNVTGIFLMFLLPLIANLLYNLEPMKTSGLIGGTLQSVGQVVASGAMVSEEVKDLATIFKIVRVILLVVVVLIFGHLKHKTNEEIVEEEIEDVKKGKVKVPWYVIGFFITCALFSEKIANRIFELTHRTNEIFGKFLSGKIIDSAIIGVLSFVVFSIFKIPYTLLISVIIGVTNIIPFFGPFIGAIPSFIIILFVSPTKALIFLILIFIIQQIDGNIIGPKILGDSIGISAFWILFAILVAGEFMGLVGMIIGVPVFAIIYSVIKEDVEYKLKNKDLPTETKDYMNKM